MPNPTPTEADVKKANTVLNQLAFREGDYNMRVRCISKAIADAREEMREKAISSIEQANIIERQTGCGVSELIPVKKVVNIIRSLK